MNSDDFEKLNQQIYDLYVLTNSAIAKIETMEASITSLRCHLPDEELSFNKRKPVPLSYHHHIIH